MEQRYMPEYNLALQQITSPLFISKCIQFLLIHTYTHTHIHIYNLAGHLARMEEGRSALKMLTGKPTGNGPLGRPRRKWEDNIRMDLEEI